MKEGSSRGRLIALEGIDGSGKSTHLKLAARALREKGFEVTELKEPTGGQWGERIRWLRQGDVTGREEVELFLKDRQEDVQHNIKPALEAGKTVLIDRYYFSTMAYQGARGIDVEEIRKLNEEFAPVPDLVKSLMCRWMWGLNALKRAAARGRSILNAANTWKRWLKFIRR